jgi:uncharacterized delta-60 repeat protein
VFSKQEAAMPKRSIAISLLLVATAASVAVGASGGPEVRVDRSFGRHGSVDVRAAKTYRSTFFTAISPLPDGSLTALRGNGYDPEVLRRYSADGRLDRSFPPQTIPPQEEAGDAELELRRAVDLPGFEIDQILSLPSGETVVAGRIVTRLPAEEGAGPTLIEVALARLDPQGTLDPRFGSGGIVKLEADLGIVGERLLGIEARPGESLALVVHAKSASFLGADVARSPSTFVALDAAGRLDASFGGGTIHLPDTIEVFHVLSDGGLLLAGERWGKKVSPRDHYLSDLFLSRYTAAGQPDGGFGEGGSVVLDLAGIDLLGAALWGEDGSAWLGGAASRVGSADCRRFYNFCPETPFVVPVSAAGSLDSRLGRRGVLLLDRLAYPYGGDAGGKGVLALAPRPGGGVYAAGGSGTVAFIAALSAAGRLVRGFGRDGILTEADAARGRVSGHAVAVDRRGRLLVAGGTDADVTSLAPLGALFRLKPNGALNRRFGGGDGFVRLPGHGDGIALAPDGSAFVLSAHSTPAVSKVEPSGRRDPSFGEEGTVALPTVGIVRRGRRGRQVVRPESIAALSDGRVLVAGTAGKDEARVVLFRLRPDGGFDRSFAGDGIAIRDCGPRLHCRVNQMALQRDGRILLAGKVEPRPEDPETLAVMRLQPDGQADRSFGGDGLVVRRIGTRSYASALAVGRGGRIFVAGRTWTYYRVGEALLRLRPDGRLDRRFGHRGILSRPVAFFPHGFADRPRQIFLLGGRVLVLRDGHDGQLVTYSSAGRGRRAFSVGRGAETSTYAGRAPFAAIQDGRLVLGWKVLDRPGRHLRLQRLLLGG